MTDANGLYHMRARYYNPELKRFVNRDVVRGTLDASQTLNRYAYVNGNPISYIDPFGLSRDGDSIWLQGGSFLIDTLPYVGTVKVFQQAFSGVNKMTGTQLSTGERWAEGVGSTMSFIPIPGMKHVGKYGTDGVVSLWRKLDLQFFAGKRRNNTDGFAKELFLPDEAYGKNLPKFVEPGTKSLNKYDDLGALKQTKYYDDYGREKGWVDFTDHGYPQNHSVPHWHEVQWNERYPVGGYKIDHRMDTDIPFK